MYTQAQQTASHTELDPLTLLPNRRALRDRLDHEIRNSQESKKLVGLLLMDLDGFKEVNHTLGHQVGDDLLQQIGARLSKAIPISNTVARVGGDEFAVVAPLLDAVEDASRVASGILKCLEDPFDLSGLTINTQASIGIALSPDHGTTADRLMQRADMAMYAAKKTKTGCAVYSAELNHNSQRRLFLMGELRRAIVQDQLFLHYQPKINLQTGQTNGVEALVRWHHPQFGVIRPNHFIPLAEKTGLVMPLTLWVIHAALRQSQIWKELGLDITIAANLSAWNLQSQELPEQIAGLLKTCCVDPGRLQLEITESAIMVDPGRALRNLKYMTNMGLKFAIDDFGTGYSSLAYLKKLPVHEIKIDKSFVLNMSTSNDDVVIVRSTIDLGHNLGLKVVAEGVESEQVMCQLATLGCDDAQGFFMSPPLSDAEVATWVMESPERLNRILTGAPLQRDTLRSFARPPRPVVSA
jgi:diguanylate cyclase (GGDEF)-like protein